MTLDREAVSARLASVRLRIASAAESHGRRDEDITLVVVTKFHGPDLVRLLAAEGVTDVGENRHQEAVEKFATCQDLGLTWHFIGQLQSNKARAVRHYASVVHSVDRPSLVDALDRAGREEPELPTLDCLIQVNLTDDPGRGGVADSNLEPLAERVMAAESLRLRGIMAVAPLGADPGPAFERVARMSERLRRLDSGATWISTGMSHDFVEAIAHGATHLRIGTEITGKRDTTT